MEKQAVVDLIHSELPGILQQDETLWRRVVELTQRRYADRIETESRFDRMLAQMKIDREDNNRRWEEQNRKWEEQNRKWEENHQVIKAMLAKIDAQEQKHNASIGALGARWGIYSETAFRNGLKGILEQSFGVRVENLSEYDPEGKVFDQPDQIELDVIIYNNTVILCEIKSSISRSDMLTFYRKTVFYQETRQRTVNRKLIISPMVDPMVEQLAPKYGIEVYSHALDVPIL
jgi:hypothetical protein